MAESPRLYAGLDVTWAGALSVDHRDDDPVQGLVLAMIDDCDPMAVEDTPTGLRVFFFTSQQRDAAATLIAAMEPSCGVAPVDIPDEQWAARSQASLTAVTVGRLTVSPPWDLPEDRTGLIIIQPSMGFGTGHHASTRLCLQLLQDATPQGARVLDAGTGSGVLALAAWQLGAASVVAVDFDADAVTSAQECVELNDATGQIDLRQADLERDPTVPGEPFSLVLANLTGGMLVRLAPRLAALLSPAGTLIVSGVTREEEEAVAQAFDAVGLPVTTRLAEDGWVGLRLTSPSSTAPASAPR